MGRPFDFENLMPSNARPEEYKDGDYLTANSVVNTVYSLFDVPTTEWRMLTRNGEAAKILGKLLT